MYFSFSKTTLDQYFPGFHWEETDNSLWGVFYFKDSDVTSLIRIDGTEHKSPDGGWLYALYEIEGDCSSEPIKELQDKCKFITTVKGYFAELYSEEKKDIPLVVAICGESGSGKTVLSKALKDRYGIPYIVSHTTRPMREGETDGVEHWFDTYSSEEDLPAKEDMLAYTYFGGNHYYALMSDIKGMKAVTYTIDEAGIIVLLDIEKQGKIKVMWIQITRPDNPTEKHRTDRDRDREDAQKKLSDMKRWPDAYIVNNYTSEKEYLDIETDDVAKYIKNLTDGYIF